MAIYKGFSANMPQHHNQNPTGIDPEDKLHFRARELQSYIGQFILPHDETGRSGGAMRSALFDYFVDKGAPQTPEGNEGWYFNQAVDVSAKSKVKTSDKPY